MSDDRVFIDTNILVYAKLRFGDDGEKRDKAIRFLKEMKRDVILSVQVINEFSSVLLKHKVADGEIRRAVRNLAKQWQVVPISLDTVEIAWDLREKFSFSYWDSLILASALENGCSCLFTEDLQHDQVIENKLRIVNPFLISPEKPLG